ncbi:MAG: hypothetical protein ACP5UZ_08210, partial [Thermoplasmata archaeon]
TIAAPVDSYVLSTIVKENPVPINAFMMHGEIHVTYFLENISPDERTLFASLNPVILGNVVEITERINSAVIKAFAENAHLVPTLADAEIYVKGKNLFSSFRFHSSDLLGAGKLIKKIVFMNDDLEQIQMTRSNGIVEILKQINERIPLSVITFSFTQRTSQQFIAEWKAKSKDPLEGIMYNLQEEDEIQQYNFSGEPTSSLIESIYKDHIPLASYLELHENDKVKVIVHLPSCLLKSFLVRLYQSLEDRADFRVDSIENYGENRAKLSEFHII